MFNLDTFNNLALEYTDNYFNLKVFGKTVRTPYYINNIQPMYSKLLKEIGLTKEQIDEVNKKYKNREIPFGWYRGKGTPEEISTSTEEISHIKLDVSGSSPEAIAEFMKLYGIGVDCSGYIFNTLYYTFQQLGKEIDFMNSLSWTDKEKQTVNYAGVFAFAGNASELIDPSKIRPTDLLLTQINGEYEHMGIFLENDQNELLLCESSIDFYPSGVQMNKAKFVDGKLYVNDRIRFRQNIPEYRRLNILKNL